MAFDISGYSGQAIQIGVAIVGVVISIGAVVGIFFIVKNINKYNTPVKVWYNDPFGKIRQKKDIGGIFHDKKSDMKLFFLKKSKVGMKPDIIPFVDIDAKYFPKREVHIFQHSLKNFSFITPKVGNPEMELSVGEADLNWAIHEIHKVDNTFVANDLKQIFAFVGLIIIVFAIIILVYFVVQKFEVLSEVATKLEATANILRTAGTGTAVVGG